MARPLRIEYDGALYHVTSRGNDRKPIFKDDGDRELLLRTLARVNERLHWICHAYCLMGNHYHLLIETPEGNLVAGMKWFQNTYTRRLNTRHRLWGHVFGGRYKAIVVESEEEEGNGKVRGDYLATLMDYVHLNPARAKLLAPQQALSEYRWSSWPEKSAKY